MVAAAPAAISLAALLQARGLSALVEATVGGGVPLGEARPVARDVTAARRQDRIADPILDRNPFDHVTGALRARNARSGEPSERDTDPAAAPRCEGVRPLVVVSNDDAQVAVAVLEVGGQRVLRRRGGDVGGKRVAYVGRDRVWLEGEAGLCQALLFGQAPPLEADRIASSPSSAPRSALEVDVAHHIVKRGPGEYAIDRPTVDRILEAQQELMKARVIPEKEGDRIVGMTLSGIKTGSVLALLGLENGDRLESINGFEVSDPEKMLEAYVRLRLADRLTVHLTRRGKPTNLDYTIR